MSSDGWMDVWARPLADGTMAVGLFNRSPEPATVTVKFSDLGISGTQPVRDLWQQKDLGTARDQFTATVPRHGVVFVKIGALKRCGKVPRVTTRIVRWGVLGAAKIATAKVIPAMQRSER